MRICSTKLLVYLGYSYSMTHKLTPRQLMQYSSYHDYYGHSVKMQWRSAIDTCILCGWIKGTNRAALLPLSCSTVLCFTSEKHNKLVIAWTVCAVWVIKQGLEAPYNTRLRLMLYGPLDPTLCALLLIQH